MLIEKCIKRIISNDCIRTAQCVGNKTVPSHQLTIVYTLVVPVFNCTKLRSKPLLRIGPGIPFWNPVHSSLSHRHSDRLSLVHIHLIFLRSSLRSHQLPSRLGFRLGLLIRLPGRRRHNRSRRIRCHPSQILWDAGARRDLSTTRVGHVCFRYFRIMAICNIRLVLFEKTCEHGNILTREAA
jgi:hypothetical protein